ncbi:MAG: aspartyl protease family protein [Polaribacter sp.]|nr:aspartyl protease family protein [Polaribacter sp.]MDG1993793.1 aspartyl protease family protein [Polaribacter sp.]
MKKSFLFFLVLVAFSSSLRSQSTFNFLGSNQKEQSVRFNLINNLVVIPMEVNGKKLSFILDTGVNKTILFNLSQNDSLGLNDVRKVTLQGLGKGASMDALISGNNTLKIKDFVGENQEIYVLLKDTFDVSAKMGITIHGIVGYKLFKDAVVHINYLKRRVYFYNPQYYTSRKCRKCQTFPLQFYRNKPYVDAKVQLDSIGNQQTDVKLLIDLGGSESVWLFENSKEIIQTPIKHFKDVLGEGISGTIYGNRSRIPQVSIGKFTIKEPTVSFLDSTSTFYARHFKQRNGSIGGNILKRFKVWVDYQNKKITLKKSGSFRGGFEYNMSGLDVVYNGKVLVKEKAATTFSDAYSNGASETATNKTISLVSSYTYRFKPSYIVKHVLENSPADLVGIQEGDIILSINGKPAHQLTLKELIGKFKSGHNKKIRMYVQRSGVEMKFQFRLVKKI